MREDELLRFRWIADPQISPDGRTIAFTLVRIDADEDEYRTDLWLARDIAGRWGEETDHRGPVKTVSLSRRRQEEPGFAFNLI